MIEAYLMHEKERNAQGIPALPLTPEQKAVLDRRLDAFAIDGNFGRPAKDVISDIRSRL